MNSWWGRSTVCLSANQFAENLLDSCGADVKRSKLEGRRDADSDDTGRDSHRTSTCTSARRSRARNTSTRSARESTQDQGILVRNRQNFSLPRMRDSRSGEVTHSRMQIVSRCLGREPPNSIGGGGETWNRCRSRRTTAGPEWKFDGS